MRTIWFRRKQYGWGWYPVGWRGWSVIVSYLVVVGAGSFAYENEPVRIAVMMAFSTAVLVGVSYAKGERWQWGGASKGARQDSADVRKG